ncbi:hypothetical protein VUR80DRAFT_6586 [Thermomyces stellatus]
MATLFFFSPGPLPRHTKYSHFHSTGIHVYQCRMVLAPGISIRPVWVQMCGSSVDYQRFQSFWHSVSMFQRQTCFPHVLRAQLTEEHSWKWRSERSPLIIRR